MRTSRMVSSRLGPLNPGAIRSMSHGVASTPASVNTEVTRVSSPATAPATRRACASPPSPRSAA